MLSFRPALIASGLLTVLLATPAANAAVYSYVDWTSADVAAGKAIGTITLPDDSTVEVTFEATNPDGSPGTLYGAQVDGGTNYWQPTAPYESSEVENAPPTPDILQLAGGQDQTYTVQLSEPIKDPLMAIVSLGQPGSACTYVFDSPFTIVSQGPGWWGGTETSLIALPGDVLEGQEGHGTIRFVGTFATFSWTVPSPESWHGFTFGIRTTEALEPSTGSGGAGGEGNGGRDSMGGADAQGGEEAEGGRGPEGGTSEVPGGATGTGGGTPGAGGEDGSTAGESSEGGQGTRENAQTKADAGCNCALVPSSPGLAALVPALGALTFALRRRRDRSRGESCSRARE